MQVGSRTCLSIPFGPHAVVDNWALAPGRYGVVAYHIAKNLLVVLVEEAAGTLRWTIGDGPMVFEKNNQHSSAAAGLELGTTWEAAAHIQSDALEQVEFGQLGYMRSSLAEKALLTAAVGAGRLVVRTVVEAAALLAVAACKVAENIAVTAMDRKAMTVRKPSVAFAALCYSRMGNILGPVASLETMHVVIPLAGQETGGCNCWLTLA